MNRNSGPRALHRQPRAFTMRIIAAIATMCLFLLAASPGCIGVPVPHKEKAVAESRRVITTQESQFLQIAQTSREDVLLRLGEPRWRFRDDSLIAYEWTTSKSTMMWLDLTPIAYSVPLVFPRSNELGNAHYLFIEFDRDGLVKRFEFKDEDATWFNGSKVDKFERSW